MPTMSSAPENNFQSRGAYVLPFELSAVYPIYLTEKRQLTNAKTADYMHIVYMFMLHCCV